jgi:predicted DNA-binding helix-hairpin-helix protein
MTDPKQAYALQHPELFPLEINHASLSELLRVPGIGPLSAKKIVALRRESNFYSADDLKRIGVVTKRALPFILLQGKRFFSSLQTAGRQPSSYSQISLWSDVS